MHADMDREAVAMAFFLQGALLSAASTFANAQHGALAQPVVVQQPVTAAGDARPYFQVILPSGIVLEVAVTGKASA